MHRILLTATAAALFSTAAADLPLVTSQEWMRDTSAEARARAEKGLEPVRPMAAPEKAAATHRVRCYYLLPSNRTAQADAVEKLQDALLFIQEWYADQMELNGYGPKTFELETEPDGVTPKIHVITSDQPDTFFHTNPWSNVAAEAGQAGFPHWQAGEVMASLYEAHVQRPNPPDPGQAFFGAFNGGASFGSGSDPGVGMTGSVTMTLLSRSDLLDTRDYAGLVVPEIGPAALTENTFAWFDGDTISELSSVMHGIVLHELSHGFGIGHDFRNDLNFNGNMMGNGFRGTRGWFHPEMFTDHFTRLNPTSAARMNVSRYFNTGQNWTENTPPAVTTPEPNGGTITISPNGMAEFAFTANDPSGISLALVRIAGNTVGSIEFSGETNVSATFSTPFAEVGQTQDIGIDVFDTQGNLRNVNRSLTFSNPMGYNLAPRPLVWADRGQIVAGESVEFSAWFSGDPDGSVNDLLVEWDTDGDGTYDTAPTTDKLLTLTPQNPGIINLGFRITDAGGAVTEGMPLRLRVDPQQADVDADLWMIEGE